MKDRSPRNLALLAGMLPSMVKGTEEGKIGGKGKAQHIPDKYCVICTAVFGSAPVEAPMKAYVCGMCNQKLEEGQTAIVCGNRHGFIANSKSLSDKAGKILYVSPATMDEFAKLHKVQTNVETKAEENPKTPESN